MRSDKKLAPSTAHASGSKGDVEGLARLYKKGQFIRSVLQQWLTRHRNKGMCHRQNYPSFASCSALGGRGASDNCASPKKNHHTVPTRPGQSRRSFTAICRRHLFGSEGTQPPLRAANDVLPLSICHASVRIATGLPISFSLSRSCGTLGSVVCFCGHLWFIFNMMLTAHRGEKSIDLGWGKGQRAR